MLNSCRESGWAIQFAPPHLREDREIALAACAQDGTVLSALPEVVRQDPGVQFAAIAQTVEAREFAPEATPDFVREASRAGVAVRILERFPLEELTVIPLIRHFLVGRARPNLMDTPLMALSGMGDAEVVQTLAANGVPLNAVNHDEVSALMQASYLGQTEVVKVLCKAGANVNQRSNGGATALHFAGKFGHEDTVRVLCASGADKEAVGSLRGEWGSSESDVTPLFSTCAEGWQNVVEILCDMSANVAATDARSKTPLYIASARGHAAVVETLLAKSAASTIDIAAATGKTALFAAAEKGEVTVVQKLLEAQASTDLAEYKSGFCPLLAAAQGGYLDVIQAFVDSMKQDPLIGAAAAARAEEERLAALAREAEVVPEGPPRAGLDQRDFLGRTALWHAAYGDKTDVVTLLCSANVDMGAAEYADGEAPLHVSARGGYLQTVTALIEAEADARQKQNKGLTPVMIAMKENEYRVQRFLATYS